MSNSSIIELGLMYDNDNLNTYKNFYDNSQDSFSLNHSEISKSRFSEPYHIYCKVCNRVQVIEFISNNKIKLICECEESPRVSKIKDCFDKYLFYSDKIDIDGERLKCYLHPEEKYILYCKECDKNKCSICAKDCIHHKNKTQYFALDENTINNRNYIFDKIKERNQFYIDNLEYDTEYDDNVSRYKLIPKNFKKKKDEENNNINNEISIKEGKLTPIKIEKNIILNDETKKCFINLMNINNNDKLDETEFYLISLLSIILDDSQNYPNYSHIKTISNAEKFITLISEEYNQINIKYEFERENIVNNAIELFGNIFVNNNKEKCFLLINKKMIDLNRFINFEEIFDDIPKNFPVQLDVKLIERKNKIMDNFSFMFYEISLLKEVNFEKYNTINIKNMSYMFYNCSLIKELSDSISLFKTINVDDMRYMFYNCSSLIKLPDISNFNTENVVNMNYMFSNCSSLKKLPDISNWNLKNVTDISHIFDNCTSLEELPEISKWDVSKVKYFKEMCRNCKSLKKPPNLGEWKLKIGIELPIDSMFKGCDKLEIELKIKKKMLSVVVLNHLLII